MPQGPHAPADTPRAIADDHVETVTELNPFVAEMLGTRPGSDLLPDYSPDGQQALADAARATLARVQALDSRPALTDHGQCRAARLLHERLGAELDRHTAGDGLRQVNNLMSPLQQLRTMLLAMPRNTADDWAVVARRLRRVPEALRGYRAALDAGLARGLRAAPRQAATVAGQLTEVLDGRWYHRFTEPGPDALRAGLDAAADEAAAGLAELRDYIAGTYLPAVEGTPDAVGRERYLRGARQWTGLDPDPEDAYAYGWEEYRRLHAEMITVADKVLPGATPHAAMDHLNRHGEAVEGEENIRRWLQDFMDRAIEELDGTHFDIAGPLRTVESMIAPPGAAAAPHYTPPSMDFSRPGRTWLPTLGETRFPTWPLVSIWYHEGVPGHHLQLAQWRYAADRLSTYQISLGQVSATTEGWALYAERLADELGLLTDPAHRLGYLENQMLRAIRVIIDIGMHLELRIPQGEEFHPGEVWHPGRAEKFLNAHSGMSEAFNHSEIVRYLGVPGQAISYKLGERAWLAGRETARRTAAERGREFDLKAWHMAALSLGSLGLGDLAGELAEL
ncbi:DUF885 domain-containing protein [Streptomyces aidingensis]|uniref:Uncharacterized conserved protein, DUF885 familyt n=1 Tax=Streptomyces aidingensis TaxID=910347 RepID=A0A1I1K0P6_9ACTN|nr:DUF885 domain-containing protein [Streptomyces aidingensis]SFC54527.1 Uncharacterized conserved protein, DUF885 familyt [Streptomyces aidingensis]